MAGGRLARSKTGGGSRLCERGCSSSGGLVRPRLSSLVLVVEQCAHMGNQPFSFLALYVLYTYMLKQRRKVLGKGKTVGGVSKAQ